MPTDHHRDSVRAPTRRPATPPSIGANQGNTRPRLAERASQYGQ